MDEWFTQGWVRCLGSRVDLDLLSHGHRDHLLIFCRAITERKTLADTPAQPWAPRPRTMRKINVIVYNVSRLQDSLFTAQREPIRGETKKSGIIHLSTTAITSEHRKV